jgi:16S rRNA C1402 (ribose-2'-O) methylase RsmI
LTKLFETVERGTLSQLSLAWPDGEATLKGEYVVVIAGAARD